MDALITKYGLKRRIVAVQPTKAEIFTNDVCGTPRPLPRVRLVLWPQTPLSPLVAAEDAGADDSGRQLAYVVNWTRQEYVRVVCSGRTAAAARERAWRVFCDSGCWHEADHVVVEGSGWPQTPFAQYFEDNYDVLV